MVEADAEAQEALDVLAVGRIEAEAADRLGQRAFLVAVGDLGAGQPLRLLGGLALREMDHVDGLTVRGEQRLDSLDDRALAVAEVEGNRALVGEDVGHAAIGELRDPLLDDGRIAQRRRHQEEARMAKHEQWNLPGPAALAVREIVELVHGDVGSVGGIALSQRHVGEDFGGAAEDRRGPVDRGVAGQHADVLGAEIFA